MGKMSQKKGRAAEMELCRILNDNGIPAVPGTAMCYGSEPDISGVKGFHCEVKRRERVEIGAWMKQATEDAKKFNDGWPCVFFRRNREDWRVVLPLSAWLELYERAYGGEC